MAWTLTLLLWVTLIPLMIADMVDSYKYMKRAKAKAKFWNAL